ncbi:hypothetical protein [Natronorubrum sp. A-ect3]|uniref:hypothetical protein n=1 Tax=Natronorubrum sp. A-ect3 TaxID=3242698 RepID=UPI00359D9A99
MTDHERCHECGTALSLVAADSVETARESVGFGQGNDRIRRFCSTHCRALWADVTVVRLETRQTTLAAFNGAARGDADAIAWAVR